MFDALCHLPLFVSPDEARTFLEQARAHGVTDVLCAGTDPTRVELAYTIEGVRLHRACGVHPEHAQDDARDAQLRALAAKLSDGTVAIGECGLDNREGHPPLDAQERTLRAQLALARERELPVILHLVGAWSRAMDVLDDDAAHHGPLPRGGVWHAFAGPKEAIARAERHNLALSVGGLVLNPHARRLHDALAFIGADLLVVETDMPHEPPVRLRDVVKQVAALLGVPQEDVARRTHDNARRIFRC